MNRSVTARKREGDRKQTLPAVGAWFGVQPFSTTEGPF